MRCVCSETLRQRWCGAVGAIGGVAPPPLPLPTCWCLPQHCIRTLLYGVYTVYVERGPCPLLPPLNLNRMVFCALTNIFVYVYVCMYRKLYAPPLKQHMNRDEHVSRRGRVARPCCV